MSNPSLFDVPGSSPDPGTRVRGSDPDTSRQAALAVDLNARCREVLMAGWLVFDHSNFTDGELAGAVHEDRNIVARRRKDLVDAGLVAPQSIDAGDQMARTGQRGRNELVWVFTEAGRLKAEELLRAR